MRKLKSISNLFLVLLTLLSLLTVSSYAVAHTHKAQLKKATTGKDKKENNKTAELKALSLVAVVPMAGLEIGEVYQSTIFSEIIAPTYSPEKIHTDIFVNRYFIHLFRHVISTQAP